MNEYQTFMYWIGMLTIGFFLSLGLGMVIWMIRTIIKNIGGKDE